MNGTRAIEVRLWDSASEGDGPLCTWLEFVVGGISLGRTKVGAVPYAVQAERAVEATHTISADRASGADHAEAADHAQRGDTTTTDNTFVASTNGTATTFTNHGVYEIASSGTQAFHLDVLATEGGGVVPTT